MTGRPLPTKGGCIPTVHYHPALVPIAARSGGHTPVPASIAVLRRVPTFPFPKQDIRLDVRNGSLHRGGFTLLDLLIVVIILGVIGMMILPQIGSIANQTKLNSAAWELISAFQYAQTMAIEYQRPFQVKVFRSSGRNQFLVKDHQYESDASAYPNNDPPIYSWGRIYHPVDKKPYIIDFDDVQSSVAGEVSTREEFRGVTIDSVPGGGNDAEIVFYPDGHSGNSDSVVVMSLGSETKTITVDGYTGKVSVQ